MNISQLPLHTWIVIEHRSLDDFALVSQHASQREAESARNERNKHHPLPRYSACMLVDPIAERMGGHRCPTRAVDRAFLPATERL
jgi:hypothetical protein